MGVLLVLGEKSNRMNVSQHLIDKVIKTYVKNMKRLALAGWGKHALVEGPISISEEGIKKMLVKRIEKNVTKRSRNTSDPGIGRLGSSS